MWYHRAMARSKPVRRKAPARGAAAGSVAPETYRLMVEHAPSAIVLTDSSGVIILVNARAESLFGYARGELRGQPIEVLLPESMRARHRADREGYAAAPDARAMGAGRDLFGRRKDGSRVPVEIGLNPIPAAGGTLFMAAVVDITERKRLEERFRLAVEAAPNAMVMTGGDGRIVLANAQAERLFGYSQSELLGQGIELLVPERSRGAHVGYRQGFTARPEARPMGSGRDLYGRRKDGREIPIEIGLNPIRTEAETFVLAAVVDITERRELQRRVAQSEALAAVGSMAAILAHEIRNPLGSIVMAARSLEHGDLTAEDRKTVSAVLTEESQRLNRTLQDFLLFARPREPKLERADLNALVSETAKALGSDAELLGRSALELALDPGLAPFPHDPDQVRQVLWNLLLNGIQAMGSGRGTLRVSTGVEDGQAALRVQDSGPGIDPSVLERVFDPFFTTKKKGTGLGLAICRRIAQAHGGRLEANNAAGSGALFVLRLPLAPRLP
jgi:PAS domain S-box-containing protein